MYPVTTVNDWVRGGAAEKFALPAWLAVTATVPGPVTVKEDPDRVLFIDVGGSNGHATKVILEKNPGLPPARCMLQDREEVVATFRGEKSLSGIQTMAIDFHKEQPVKGE